MIHSLSNNVILPIAGVILSIVMTMELLQLVIEKNNMNEAVLCRWCFQTLSTSLIMAVCGLPERGRRERQSNLSLLPPV